jgi:hypothetical protein
MADTGFGFSPSSASPPDATEPSTEAFCVQLGWSIARLHLGSPRPVVGKTTRRHLPALDELTANQLVQLDIARAKACISSIAKAAGFDSTDIKDLDALSGSTSPSDAEVTKLHLELLIALNGAGANLGKAYLLGQSLAYTCRVGQTPEALLQSFEPATLVGIKQSLNDLTSALPKHAAKAVGHSLTWWRDIVYMTSGAPGRDMRAAVGDLETDAPGAQRKGRKKPKVSTGADWIKQKDVLLALPRQGDLWLSILAGDKDPLDLLTPDDYLESGVRLMTQGRDLLEKIPKGFLLVVASSITVLAAAVGVLVSISNVHGGAQLAAYLVTIGAWVGTLWKALAPRLRSAISAVEKPLWQASLDTVCAEAVSLWPVGNEDLTHWSKLANKVLREGLEAVDSKVEAASDDASAGPGKAAKAEPDKEPAPAADVPAQRKTESDALERPGASGPPGGSSH